MCIGRRAAIMCLAIASACGGGSDATTPQRNTGPNDFTNVPAPPNGVAQFSVLPVSIAAGATLTALGNLSPPGHVLPTDHVYFYDWDLASRRPSSMDVRDVYMPATGAAFLILPITPPESKVMFRATNNFYFYLDHIVLSSPIAVGQVIQAGTRIAKTLPGQTVDLGAFDMSVQNAGFVNTARYGPQTLNCVSPWKYFTPELQTQIYSHVYRAPTAPDKDGKIDFGVAGRLVGDWFLQGMPADSSSGPYGWTRSVSFVYDYFDPTQVRISIGGTVAPAGVWGIDSTATPPANISVASGLVAYRLYGIFDFKPLYGLMLVQMVNDSTIKVQVFPGSQATTGQFDGQVATFVR